MNRFIGNITGSFSDGAILFPIIVALSATTHFNSAILFLTAGIAYICSGYLFRIPMPVQPLKSLVITAITIGATLTEIRFSAVILGVVFLSFTLLPFDKVISKIPRSIIHGVQLSLGILLISKGLDYLLPQLSVAYFIFFALIITTILTFSWGCRRFVSYCGATPRDSAASGTQKSSSTYLMIRPAAISGTLPCCEPKGFLLVDENKTATAPGFSLPILGLLSFVGFIVAIFNKNIPSAILHAPSPDNLRPLVLLSLILPQIVLTSVNSVVATVDAANRYFPEKSTKITKRNLLYSIGIGNIVTSTLGGLPFCHGSGGLTAHFKGGARDWWSNLFIGGALILLSLLDFAGVKLIPNYPSILLSVLLVSVGFFHIQLAKPTWIIKSERARLLLMGLATLLTHNLLFGFIIGFTPDIILFLKPKLLWSTNR